MKITDIRKLQAAAGYDKMQNIIETGMVWHMEGSMGREAMDLLRVGACTQQAFATHDKGSLGTLENNTIL
jgi:hypothetical protein